MSKNDSTQTDLLLRVQNIVSAVTRYPLDILTPDASLEDDLGIDSVKQAEIMAVLSREFGTVDANLTVGKIRNLQDIAQAIIATSKQGVTAAGSGGGAVTSDRMEPLRESSVHPVRSGIMGIAAGAAGAAPTAAPTAVVSDAPAAARVRAVIARVTRYPEHLLTNIADLEDDLGIDSVKQSEILVALQSEFSLSGEIDLRRQGVRTIGGIIEAVSARLPAVTAPAPKAPAAPVPLAPPVGSARPHLPLVGKIALVTGSGRGIGKVIVTRLAALGATVVVNSFHSRDLGEETAREIVKSGGNAIHIWGSVANVDHLTAMFSEIDARLGGLDFLVCSASDGIIGPFDAITPRDWERSFRTCVIGAYECAMRAAPLMRRRRGGAIVTMSTVTAHRYLEGFGSQGVIKAAVESLTRYLACELAPAGIRTNCVSGGPIHGELLKQLATPTRLQHWEEITPGGSLCTPEDVAAVVEMLLSPGAARVNGAVWVVDNGVSVQIDGALPRATTGVATPALPAQRLDDPFRALFASSLE